MVVLFDDNDCIVVANHAWCEFYYQIMRYARPGVPFEEHPTALVKAGLAPGAIDDPQGWIARRLQQHHEPAEPFEMLCHDERWVLVNEQQLANGGTVLVMSEITEQKRVQGVLAEQRDEICQLTDALPALVVAVDSNLRFRFANEMFCRYYDMPAADIVGASIEDVLSSALYEAARGNVELALAGSPSTLEVMVDFAGVGERTVIISLARWKLPDGTDEGYFTAIQDVSDLVAAQQALKEANSLDERASDYLQRIRRATQRMDVIIDALLNLSRLGRQNVHPQSVDLTAVALEKIAELCATEPERQVDVDVQSDMVAIGDARLLRLVVGNLVENAWKYTGPRACAKIEMGVREEQDGLIVYWIKDNSIGFDMRYADKLFEAFQRLHLGAEFSGTGIGLATVQRAIQWQGLGDWCD